MATPDRRSLENLCGMLGMTDTPSNRPDGAGVLSRQTAVAFKCDFAAAARLERRDGSRWRAEHPTWHAELAQNRRRVGSLLQRTGELCERLESAGCPVAAVEGGGVVAAFPELDPGGYDSGDVDLLVGGEGALRRAVVVARELGWAPTTHGPRHATLESKDNEGLPLRLELDAEAFYRRFWPRPGRRIDWLAQRTGSDGGSPPIRVLRPEYSLVFTAVHASIHTFVRSPGLRLFVDMDRLIDATRETLDWDRVAHVAAMGRHRVRLFAALTLCQRWLGTPVPARLLSGLAPPQRQWRLLDKLLEGRGFRPPGRPLRRVHVAAAEALFTDS